MHKSWILVGGFAITLSSTFASAGDLNRYSLDTSLTGFGSVQHTSHSSQFSGLEFEIEPRAKLSENLSLASDFAFSRGIYSDQPFTVIRKSEVGLKLARQNVAPALTVAPSLMAILPLNHDHREIDGFRIGARASLKTKVDFTLIGVSGLSLKHTLSYTRLVHTSPLTQSGLANARDSVKNTLSLDYDFNDSWTLGAGTELQNRWSETHFSRADLGAFVHVDYQWNRAWGASVGYMNSGDTLAAMNPAQPAQLFDRTRSIAYVSVSYTY